MASSVSSAQQNSSHHHVPFMFSQIPGNPTFRNSAVNAVAVVPLLSSNKQGEIATTHSARSFHKLMEAFSRQVQDNNNNSSGTDNTTKETDLLLVVPNSSLTRPGDWRYNETPLKGFHWQHGCQRLRVFDARPQNTRMAHDRLMNHTVTRDWIDLCPHRRTAAVIGVLNLRDCCESTDSSGDGDGGVGNSLQRAEEELHQWAARMATPPYEVTAHGRSFERDKPIERLFVFDSFHEDCQAIDLSASSMSDATCTGGAMLAFPPVDIDNEQHLEMMDLHLKIVVNDLAVSIFQRLEAKIKESDAISRSLVLNNPNNANTTQEASLASTARRSITRIIAGASGEISNTSGTASGEEPMISPSKRLSLSNMAGFVNPDSKLGKESPPKSGSFSASQQLSPVVSSFASETSSSLPSPGSAAAAGISSSSPAPTTTTKFANSTPKLITPLDKFWEHTALSSRDFEALLRRDAARREKWAADLSLLAGSPLDAYERYLKAAELCNMAPDPLWYASALEGCAAAHIAMADSGGYGVDEYLENNFQMPEDIMALASKKDGDSKRPGGSASKQTLPEVVFALCEEAMNITNRHETLGPLHAELLLKLAWYVSESSEAHLRCRWGEGEGCYAGEIADMPRWQKPSVYKLNFASEGEMIIADMVSINSVNRTKQVCELLHEAVSVANIDPPTRVDVAARCARMCLDGVKATQWRDTRTERIKLPRKAAFFAVTAAEAMSVNRSKSSEATTRDLWFLATQLYTKNPNPPDQGGDYGWAALRAITLNALSMQGNSTIALQAAEDLLSLLSEISPELTQGKGEQSLVPPSQNPGEPQETAQAAEHRQIGQTSGHGNRQVGQASGHGSRPMSVERSAPADSDGEVAKKASTFARQLRDSFTTITANATVLAIESKWADDEIIPPIDVPLAFSSEAIASVQTLGCVWQSISFDNCSVAQTKCINRITKLRRGLPTVSGANTATTTSLPLYVSSTLSILPDSALELERTIKAKKEGELQGAMATFFNPYENKRANKATITIVAEGEERAMSVEFTNRLSVSLVVQRCQLEFENKGNEQIKASPIAFSLPPMATGFVVHFPFSVLSSEAGDGTVIEVKGISLTLLGRVCFIPFHSAKDPGNGKNPKSATKGTDQGHIDKPRFETCPSQPRLLVRFAKSGAPVDPEKPIQISLADGELFTLPSIVLNNYPGPSGHGNVERLQIFAVDLPGLSDQKLFDSDQNKSLLSDEDFIRSLIEVEKSPPIKLRALASSLKLDEVNAKNGTGSTVTFQIGAAHSMKRLFRNGSVIKIRFRYRGASTSSSEFWRKKELLVKITCINGPRISSLDFRPDLVAGSAYAEMCRSLCVRQSEKNSISGTKVKDDASVCDDNIPSRWHRVGMDQGAHVSSSDVVFVLTVANETTSEILLRREGGQVCGFHNSPLSTVQVHPGVSARFPIVIPRIPRAKLAYLAEEVVSLTKLIWETERDRGSSSLSDAVTATGHIRIPLKSLMEIIEQHPSFASRICEPPCLVQLLAGGKPPSPSCKATTVQLGKAVELGAEVTVASWVPPDFSSKCSLALEFFCAREVTTTAATNDDTSSSSARDYVWCGKVRQEFRMNGNGGDTMKHRVKIAFVKPGVYSVSGCARIRHDNAEPDVEEIWWAPVAATLVVEAPDSPAQ